MYTYTYIYIYIYIVVPCVVGAEAARLTEQPSSRNYSGRFATVLVARAASSYRVEPCVLTADRCHEMRRFRNSTASDDQFGDARCDADQARGSRRAEKARVGEIIV